MAADDSALVFPLLRHVTSIGDLPMKDRTYFKHRIDMLDDDGEILEHLAGVDDFMLADDVYEQRSCYAAERALFTTAAGRD
jgi:hypothetical protein